MNRKERRAAKSGSKAAAPSAGAWQPLLAAALQHLQRGDAAAAAKAAESALALNPASADARYLLGTARLFLGALDAAAEQFRKAIEASPGLTEAHNNLGIVHERLGRLDEAERCYRAAIAQRHGYGEAHVNLGNALLALDRPGEAAASFRTAAGTRGAYPEAWYNLGNALLRCGDEEGAVTAFQTAIAQRAGFAEALNNLGTVLLKLGRANEALAAGQKAARAAPNRPESHYNLGEALRAGGRPDDAVAAYRQVLALNPKDADARIAIGNILLERGRAVEAQTLFREALALRPFSRRPAAGGKAAFTALLLIAPGAANTPIDFLLERARYDSIIVPLLPGIGADAAALAGQGDIVVNLVSDADWHGGALPAAAELAGRLDLPVINPPARIPATARDSVARLLSNIPGCVAPAARRLTKEALQAGLADPDSLGVPLPLLIRPSGTHGGEALEKCEDIAAIGAFVAAHPSDTYYLTRFVDFRSADGHYRKYRLFFADGAIFPYHLAIDSRWKVHHYRTDMANQEWMRGEEEAFLADPARVFDAGRMATLEAIRDAVGLDFFGIDCGIDPAGDVVVFEVNATMLIHGESGTFAYKQPYILRIRDAFEAMLARRAVPAQPR